MTQLQKDYILYLQGTRNYYYNTNDMEKANKVQAELDQIAKEIKTENEKKS